MVDRRVIDKIVALEWDFFQDTENEGGRASCQDNFTMFYVNRAAQASCWSGEMAASWLADLERAKEEGRNPLTEKYARMMASTAPEEYALLEAQLPPVSREARAIAEELTAQTVRWAEEMGQLFPHLARRARPVHSREDGPYTTSVETYHLGELLTCSLPTLRLFRDFYAAKAARGENLFIEVERAALRLQGAPSLEKVEAQLAQGLL